MFAFLPAPPPSSSFASRLASKSHIPPLFLCCYSNTISGSIVTLSLSVLCSCFSLFSHNYQLQSIAWPQHPRSPPSGPPLSTKPPSALPRPGRKISKHCTITQRTGFPTWYGNCATTITWMRRWRKSGDIKVRLRSGAYTLLCCAVPASIQCD